jgi:hypothetical protein
VSTDTDEDDPFRRGLIAPSTPIVLVVAAGSCLALFVWRLARQERDEERQQEQADHLWDQHLS